MKKTVLAVLAFVSAVNLFAAGGKDTAKSDQKNGAGKIVIENFNHTTEYVKTPERIIALSMEQAEVLAALGLADKIIMLSEGNHSIKDVLPEYRDMLKNVPTINFENVNLEYFLSQAPDLMFISSYFFNLKQFGSFEDYKQNHIGIYVSEGSYVKSSTLENTYNDIMNLGKIFRVEKKAAALVEKLRVREKAIAEKIKNVKPVRCFVFDANNNEKYFTAGGGGLYNSLLKCAGGENIFGSVEKQFFSASLEQIIAENPEVIIVSAWGKDDSKDDPKKTDGQQKIDFLKSKKEFSEIPAVKNNRFIIVPLISAFAGVQNVDAIETIAQGLHPELFK